MTFKLWWLAFDGPTQEWHERKGLDTWPKVRRYVSAKGPGVIPSIEATPDRSWCWQAKLDGWLYLELYTEGDPNAEDFEG